MISDKYSIVLDQFKVYYPSLYSNMDDWWGSGPMSIFIKFVDGSYGEFNKFDATFRYVNPVESDEPSANGIGHNLEKIIQLSGISKTELSERVGITNAMLSRYIHGKSIPSAVTVYKIAKVLGRSVDEIFDGNYL